MDIRDEDVNVLKVCCDMALGWLSGQTKALPTTNHLDQFYVLVNHNDSNLSVLRNAMQQVRLYRKRTAGNRRTETNAAGKKKAVRRSKKNLGEKRMSRTRAITAEKREQKTGTGLERDRPAPRPATEMKGQIR